MNIVFFSNPDFFGSQKRPQFSSMPRFTNMLAEGMAQRGHKISIWSPGATFFHLPVKGGIKKWMGYIDQYLIFPAKVKWRLTKCTANTLFVFTDQAQGPWVPLVFNRRHVIHCHDFLAQWSALGKIPEHKTGWTGRRYQHFIHRGCAKAKNFIVGSHKTDKDLRELFPKKKISSAIVYNGLDKLYCATDPDKAKIILGNKAGLDLRQGYFLHVGGNQWYKNREGVIEIYNAWRSLGKPVISLILIGAAPDRNISKVLEQSPYKKDIHVISGLSDLYVRYAYAGASIFIFPSLAEGFGWPIAEAMASGCPVISTDEAPMTEVAGTAGFLIPRRPFQNTGSWAVDAAQVVQKILSFPDTERKKIVEASIHNAKRFDSRTALDQIEKIYKDIAYSKSGLQNT